MDRKHTNTHFISRFSLHARLPRRSAPASVLLAGALLLLIRIGAAAAVSAWQQPLTGGLVITEFQFDPPGIDKEREWVELANLSDQSIQLAGYGLGDEELPGAGEGMLLFPEGSAIDAGEAIVVAQTAAGFRALFGFNPDYEITDTDTAVPDMIDDKQWASGKVALANDGDEILLIDAQGGIVDTLNYGDRTTYFSPGIPRAAAGQSIERFPSRCDTDSAVDWRPQQFPTPGELQVEGTCNLAPASEGIDASRYRAIGEIQGPGETSPLLNQVVTFRGVVTGVIEDQNAAGVIYHTLFVQDVAGLEDGDAATSDAVAVFLGRQPPQYRAGDQISVTGQVTEYFGLTEIDDTGLSVELESASRALPDPISIDLPQDAEAAASYLESLEGMLVGADEMLPVLGPTHSGCGFALGSTPDTERPLRHSGQESVVPPIMVLNRSDVDCSDLPAFKSGDLVSGVTGPLTFHFNQYKVVQQSINSLRMEPAPAMAPQPLSTASGDKVRVATMNLDNFLTPSLDRIEPLSAQEGEIKRRKLAYTIGHTLGCPELIGVQEVETEDLLLELVENTVDLCGFTYEVTHRESADGRGIDVALLSDGRHVVVETADLRQICSPLATGVRDVNIQCPEGEEPLFSRPPLEVALRVDGEALTVVVNHFKSKRGGEQETAPRRLAQAGHVNDLVRSRLAGDPQAAILVLGDFNDFNLSPVWQRLQEGGVLVDAMQQVPSQERYSYIFDGVSQLVDGILVSPGLAHRIESTTIAHVNADYPTSLGSDVSPSGMPFHASDHDPVLMSLSANSYSGTNGAAETAPTTTPTAAPKSTAAPTTTTAPTTTAAATAYAAGLTETRQPATVLEETVTATPLPQQAAEVSPTSQPVKPPTERDENGSRQYAPIAGLAILLTAAAVLWLARRFSN